MKNRLLHTPDGVRDIYGDECEQKLFVRDELFNVIESYGYKPIQTPTFEFFDVFGSDIGTTPSKNLYKFFDRDGNTLVLRPDVTPSVARSCAKYYSDRTDPVRLCYCADTFINNNEYQGRLKETTQLGAELMGDAGVEADAEIIALTCECFIKSGLTEFQIAVGNSSFFEAVCEGTGLTGEDADIVKDYFCDKNYFAAGEFLKSINAPDGIFNILDVLSGFIGGREALENASKSVRDIDKACFALVKLEELYDILCLYGFEKYISFDLGLLNPHDYYTGIIFDGYAYGSGRTIAKGGRYDRLVSHFGKDTPAVGCVIELDELLLCLSRNGVAIPGARKVSVLHYTNDEEYAAALKKAKELRSAGAKVALCPGGDS